MKKWFYICERITPDASGGEGILAERGNDGWELISVSDGVFYFKRERYHESTPSPGEIYELDGYKKLSVRLRKILMWQNLKRLEDFSSVTESDLLEFRGLGQCKLNELREFLHKHKTQLKAYDVSDRRPEVN